MTPGSLLLTVWLNCKLPVVPTSSLKLTILVGDSMVVRKLAGIEPHRSELLILERSAEAGRRRRWRPRGYR